MDKAELLARQKTDREALMSRHYYEMKALEEGRPLDPSGVIIDHSAWVAGTRRALEIQAPTVGEACNLLQWLAVEMKVPLESVVLRVVPIPGPTRSSAS